MEIKCSGYAAVNDQGEGEEGAEEDEEVVGKRKHSTFGIFWYFT
jgi:hypothetical protein